MGVDDQEFYQLLDKNGVTDAKQLLDDAGLLDESVLAQIDGRFMSAFVRAQKPVAKSCCASTCCA